MKLICNTCFQEFERQNKRGPIPTQCTQCRRTSYKRRNAKRSPGRDKFCPTCEKAFYDDSKYNNRKSCTKECRYAFYLREKYNVTFEEANQLNKINVCKICGSTEMLRIDHCHKTGRVRNKLCHNCNTGLGMFHDDIQTLKNAVEYLENTQEYIQPIIEKK